jgi:hypothetical protein
LFDAIVFALFILSNTLAVRRSPIAFAWVNRVRDYFKPRQPNPDPEVLDPEMEHLQGPRHGFLLTLALTLVFAIFSLKRAQASTLDLLLVLYIAALLWAGYLRFIGLISETAMAVVFVPAVLCSLVAGIVLILAILDDLGLDLLWWLIAGRESYLRFWTAMFPILDLACGVFVLASTFLAAVFVGELRFLVRLGLCLTLVATALLLGAFTT